MSIINFLRTSDGIKVEISESINYILDRSEFPLSFVIRDWISGEISYQSELWGNWWSFYDNYSFKNTYVYTKSGKLLKEFTFRPDVDGGDIEEFFNIWVKSKSRSNGLVLGAGTGRWGEWLLPVFNNECFVVLVEGDPINQEILLKTHKDRKNVKIENCVVSSTDGLVNFWIAPFNQVSSMDKKVVEKFFPGVDINPIYVPSFSINSIIDKHFDNDLDWIRIDIEGSDHDVIMSIRPDISIRLKMMVYENMNITSEQIFQINERLKNHGFNNFLNFGIDTICLKNN